MCCFLCIIGNFAVTLYRKITYNLIFIKQDNEKEYCSR